MSDEQVAETPVQDYVADAEVVTPRKRRAKAEVTEAPAEEVLVAEEVYISPQTKQEMEAGAAALMKNKLVTE